MKIRLLSWVVALWLVGASVAQAGGNQVLRVMASTVRLTVVHPFGQGSCSAFSIDQKRSLFLTAQHCTRTKEVYITGDEAPVKIMYEDEFNDLAVIQAIGQSRTSLKPAQTDIEAEVPVILLGYGHGWNQPLSVAASSVEQYLWFRHPLDLYTTFTPRCYGGQSGGPIVNTAGEVVSIVQRTKIKGNTCLGKPLSIILLSTGQFWQYQQE